MEGLACADPGARTPIGASGILVLLILPLLFKTTEGVVVGPPPGPLGRFLGFFFENFEGDSAETCAGKFPLMSMGG